MRSIVAPLAFALALTITAASCGIPEQDRAEILADVPDEVFAATTTTTTTPVAEASTSFDLILYWHDEQGRLVSIVRPKQTRPTLQEAIDELLKGPSSEENAANPARLITLDQALGNAALVPVVSGPDAAGTVTVTVSPDAGFRDFDTRTAATELVCTLTQFEGVTGVVILDGQPEAIVLPGINSEPIIGPAMRVHYGDCLTVDDPPPDESTATSEG